MRPRRHVSRSARSLLFAIAVAIALALLSLRSLFASGYVLQVDAPFGPRLGNLRWAFETPISLLIHAGVHTAGGEATGKLCMALSLFLCGIGAMLAARRLPWWARCTAGLLAVLNPWVFDRIAEGQWGVVAAAGCLFLWLAAWDALRRRPGPVHAAALILITLLTAAFSPNFIGIVAVLALFAAVSSRPWRSRLLLRWTATSLACSAALLLYGAIPFFVHSGPGTYTSVTNFGRADFAAFRAVPDGRYGVLPALAGLYGEWAERTGRIPVASSGNPWWPAATAVLVALALYGAWRVRDRAWLLGAGLVGLGLSAITATDWGLDAAVRLSQHLPLVAAYRDAQKWDALWLVALTLLGAEAAASLARSRKHEWRGPAAAAAMALATLLPAGLHQVQRLPELTKPATYPSDWYQAAAYLEHTVPPQAPVAILPWHLYEPLDFASGRLVANPAGVFFPGNLILPDDPELPGQPGPAPSPGNIGAESLGPAESHRCALAEGLRSIGAHWVVLEQTVGTQQVLDRLEPCGFVVVEGGDGVTSVLRG